MTRYLLAFLLLLGLTSSLAGESVSDQIRALLGKSADGSQSEQFLDPEQAFQFSTKLVSNKELHFSWIIAEGYYLYRDKFSLESNRTLARSWEIPAGIIKEDEVFGTVEVNTGVVEVVAYLQRPLAGEVTLQVGYQGCKDNAICYPPIKKSVTLTGTATGVVVSDPVTVEPGKPVLSVQDQITEKLKSGSIVVNMAAFLLFGLLLSLTPCVFPMIPILSGIIVGQSAQLSSRRGFILALTYVLAMSLTYAVLGVLAGSLQINIQTAAQHPWVITAFSLIFVLLALSMFGLYEIQLPAALQTRLQNLSTPAANSGLAGVAGMGAVSAIIVGPCVAPPLAGALLYISQTGNAVLGGLALFCMGLGFGVPLLVIGTSAGSILPRAGAWMDSIKHFFGVIMLAVAIWFLERVMPPLVTLLLWGTLLVTSSLYLGAFEQKVLSVWQKFCKTIALIIFIYGVCLIIGAIAGAQDKFRPLQPFTQAGLAQTTHSLPFTRISSLDGLQSELVKASDNSQIVMLDFYADWCITCIEMEKKTFTDSQVKQRLDTFHLIQADVTENNADDRKLLSTFHIYGPPAILFFDTNGNEMGQYRLVGFVDADGFIQHLDQITQ